MNEAVFFLLNDWAGRYQWLDAVMVFSAVYLIYFVFLALAIASGWAFYKNRYRRLILLGATLVIAFGLIMLIGIVYPGARPFTERQVALLIPHEPGRSFVSHHAAAAFAIAIGSWFFLSRKLGASLLAVAVVIGVARIFVGVHYPLDILGAAAAALLAAGIINHFRHHPLLQKLERAAPTRS